MGRRLGDDGVRCRSVRSVSAETPVVVVTSLFKRLRPDGANNLTTPFGLSYGIQTLHIRNSLFLSGIAIGNAVGVVTNPFFGWLSDRVGRRPLLAASYLLAAVYVLFLFFPLLRTTSTAIVILAMAIPDALLQPLSIGVSGSFYPERFDDPRLRLSGVSLGRQLGTTLGGGIMPMVAASLLAISRGVLTGVIAYFVFICALAVGAVISARETASIPLAEQMGVSLVSSSAHR
jgi:MFS family permease